MPDLIVVCEQRRQVRAQGDDLVELLVGLLSELVYLVDGRGFAPRRVALSSLSDREAKLAVHGQALSGPEQIASVVKAVTYHGAEVRALASGRWRASVILDV